MALVSNQVEDIVKSDQILNCDISLHCFVQDPLQCEEAVNVIHEQLKVGACGNSFLSAANSPSTAAYPSDVNGN